MDLFLSVKSRTEIVDIYKVDGDSQKPKSEYELLDEIIHADRDWYVGEDWKYKRLLLIDSTNKFTKDTFTNKYFYIKYQGTFPIKMNTNNMIIGSYDDCISLKG